MAVYSTVSVHMVGGASDLVVEARYDNGGYYAVIGGGPQDFTAPRLTFSDADPDALAAMFYRAARAVVKAAAERRIAEDRARSEAQEPDTSGSELVYSDGTDDSAYRSEMRDAGRGALVAR